ncbi:hypothetical protein SUGI_1143790 [Cryptomeria japonica]|nr:hypothetical protein SUGI_1143790 [Cryptomeria japonica]
MGYGLQHLDWNSTIADCQRENTFFHMRERTNIEEPEIVWTIGYQVNCIKAHSFGSFSRYQILCLLQGREAAYRTSNTQEELLHLFYFQLSNHGLLLNISRGVLIHNGFHGCFFWPLLLGLDDKIVLLGAIQSLFEGSISLASRLLARPALKVESYMQIVFVVFVAALLQVYPILEYMLLQAFTIAAARVLRLGP